MAAIRRTLSSVVAVIGNGILKQSVSFGQHSALRKPADTLDISPTFFNINLF